MKILDVLSLAFIAVFVAGWVNFGQGADLTWWKLIQVLGEI